MVNDNVIETVVASVLLKQLRQHRPEEQTFTGNIDQVAYLGDAL